MHKKLPISITVPQPCTQSWDEMTACGAGRFCAHCQKTVIDFTTWSDAALYRFFEKNNDRVCGQFLSTQLSRPIHIPYQPHSRLYRLTIALGLTMAMTQSPNLYAHPRGPQISVSAIDFKEPSETTGPGEIAGQIIDNKKEPVINAAVHVYQDGVLKGEAKSDFDGYYVVKPLDAGVYTLVVTYPGFRDAEVNAVTMYGGSTKVNCTLALRTANDTARTIVQYHRPLVDNNAKQEVTIKGDIGIMPSTTIADVAAVGANNYQRKDSTNTKPAGPSRKSVPKKKRQK